MPSHWATTLFPQNPNDETLLLCVSLQVRPLPYMLVSCYFQFTKHILFMVQGQLTQAVIQKLLCLMLHVEFL